MRGAVCALGRKSGVACDRDSPGRHRGRVRFRWPRAGSKRSKNIPLSPTLSPRKAAGEGVEAVAQPDSAPRFSGLRLRLAQLRNNATVGQASQVEVRRCCSGFSEKYAQDARRSTRDPSAAAAGWRISPQGGRHGGRPVWRQSKDGLSTNPATRTRTLRAGCPQGAEAGWPSLWLPFSWPRQRK